MLLMNETIILIKSITKDFPELFIKEGINDRIATLLNYSIMKIAGPKSEVNINENYDKYLFYPKLFITKTAKIYLHFENYPDFISSISSEERSYDYDTLTKFCSLVKDID